MSLQKIQHIAIIRLSAIGDVCHAMLVVTKLQEQHPNAHITWVTGPTEAALVRLLPNIDVHIYDKKTGIKGLFALRKALTHRSFDALVHMQWSFRSSLVSLMLKARRRIGFAKPYSREKQHWFINEQASLPKGPHVLDSFLSLIEPLGVTYPPKVQRLSCELVLPDQDKALPETYVVINPGASKRERSWTLAGYREIIAHLADKHITVVLTGGPLKEEKLLAQKISDQQSNVMNLVGKTSLAQMLRILKDSLFVISPDTGPAHMATLVGTPIIGLYAHSNPRRTGPYYDLDRVVSVYDELAQKEYGQSIQDIPWAARVHDVMAMEHIQSHQVIEKIDQLLQM